MAKADRLGAESPRGGERHDTTLTLLARARAGDRVALDVLFARYGRELGRFARGRLPRWARDVADTPDLVQETLLQAFTHLETFEYRGEGAFRAYLRQAVLNRIRDELRRAGRHPAAAALAPNMRDGGPSPLETAIGREGTERYEAGMARLKAGDREVLIARLELGLSYPEIAEATGRTSANAARMAVVRALLRLTEELGHGLPDGKSS